MAFLMDWRVYFIVMARAFLFAILANSASVFSQSFLISSVSGGGGMFTCMCCCVSCIIGCVF